MKRFLIYLTLTTFVPLGLVGLSYAISGDEVLNRVEASLTKQKDQESIVEVILYKDGKVKEKREMKIWEKSKEKRLVKFISPESVKGIGVLSLPDDKMYVYLPAYQKVRAIQGSAKDQNFQGTDFSYREIGEFNYSSSFDVKITSENDKEYVLELTKKPSSDWSYEKIIMTVDKKEFLPKKLEMYEKGKLKKVLDVIETKKVGDYNVLYRIKMSTVANNTATEIITKDTKFDQNLDAKGVFTERFLSK